MKVWVTGAQGVIGAAVAAKMRELGAYVYDHRLDVTSSQDAEEFAAVFNPDVLINCAGILGPVGPVGHNPVYEWARTINVNLMGAFNLTRAALPHMVDQNYGKIIHFSGGGAANVNPNHSAYAASKAGLVRFVEHVAEEYKTYNVQAYAVAPGSVRSKMNPESKRTPGAAVKLVEYLISDKSNHLSGRLISAVYDDWDEEIRPDGGLLRRIPLNRVSRCD